MTAAATTPFFRQSARAAFLGLALGDAYGQPLEFVGDNSVRTKPVAITAGRFRWTDDTHMAIYLARAILDTPAAALASDVLGKAIAERFVQWRHDPHTPSTAPGNTCLAGVRNYERDRNWMTSGVAESDGCGAVMRICPLAMAFAGEALSEAARIFNADTVRSAIGLLRRRPGHKAVVIAALEAAIKLSRSRAPWLDEAAVPDGDGGWRSPSALGLAVAAALRWEGSFEKVVDRAARIKGDSDSVACLAGMFVAGAYGAAFLPASWLEVLPERATIEFLADQLTDRATVTDLAKGAEEAQAGATAVSAPELETAIGLIEKPKNVRTSKTDPILVNWLKGAEALLGPGHGKIGLTFAPGKKGPALYGPPWDRDLDEDMDRLVKIYGMSVLVCLVEAEELQGFKIAGLFASAQHRGVIAVHEPVPDLHAPTLPQAKRVVELSLAAAKAGKNVVIHCRGGRGRAGTLSACCYVALGLTAADALEQVRASRKGAVETAVQEKFIEAFHKALQAK